VREVVLSSLVEREERVRVDWLVELEVVAKLDAVPRVLKESVGIVVWLSGREARLEMMS
jgi:hypothetical protein